MVDNGTIIRRTGTVGGLTLISRIFGLVRDVAIAYAFGARETADAFFVAFRIPNLLRRFFAEGALTISFVPVFTDYLRKDREEARHVVSVSFTLLAVVLVGVVLIGVLAAPWIVKAIALGFTEDPEKYALTVRLTRIMFPYILFVSLAGLAMGVLNTLKHFAAPAAAPILLNVGIIAGALVLAQFIDPPVMGLAVGVLIGGLLQLGIHLPFMARYGMWPRLRLQWKHPSIKKILPMMGASAYGAAVYQINVVVMTFLASFLAEGSVSWLWYADRVMEFPLGIFGISLATVLLPTMADHASDGNHELMRKTLNYGLRMSFFLTVPAMVGLIVLAEPIIRVLFQHGTFTAQSTTASAQALVFFALGLPFIAAVRVTTNAFFSIKDSRTPVRMANLSVVINIVAALLLMHPMAHNGLALALSIAALCNFAFQVLAYRKKVGPIGLRRMITPLVRMATASVLMGAVVLALAHYGPFFAPPAPLRQEILGLVLCISVGAAIYFLALYGLKSEEVRELKRMIKR